MAKKKPHRSTSKLNLSFDIDSELLRTKKHPQKNGLKVSKTSKGYEVVYQERLAQTTKKVFATKAEVEKYLKSLGLK